MVAPVHLADDRRVPPADQILRHKHVLEHEGDLGFLALLWFLPLPANSLRRLAYARPTAAAPIQGLANLGTHFVPGFPVPLHSSCELLVIFCRPLFRALSVLCVCVCSWTVGPGLADLMHLGAHLEPPLHLNAIRHWFALYGQQ